MDHHEATQGRALTVLVDLIDGRGARLTNVYAGTEPLATTVWPGGSLAPSCTPATAWVSPPSAGQISFTVSAAQSAALAPGRYRVLSDLTDAGVIVPCYQATLDVLSGPGVGTAPPAYTTLPDLQDHARGWLKMLQSRDDGTGFAREQGRARSWLEDCGHAHFRSGSMVMVIGSTAYGPRRSGARSQYLTDQFAADALLVTDQIKEAVAKKALAYITESVIDGDATARYSKLAGFYHNQANYLAACITLGLDTDGDGSPDIVIDLSATDPMIG
jgi:hypothetical protein